MSDYPKLRASTRTTHKGLWERVDAIQEEAKRTFKPDGDMLDGEAERIRKVLAECGVNNSTVRIRQLEHLGRWIKGGCEDAITTLRSFAVYYSQLAMDAGWSVEQTADKLKTNDGKWTTTSFEVALKPPVPEVEEETQEPEPEPEPPRPKTVIRVVVKDLVPTPEYTEDFIKKMLRELMEGASEEVIHELFLELTTNPRRVRTDMEKFTAEMKAVELYVNRLTQVLNAAADWLKHRRTTFHQRRRFVELLAERNPVTYEELIILAGGMTDETIEKAMTQFEAES